MATSMRLPEEIENRLHKLAIKTGRTKSFYIREALIEHISNLEDIYLAEERVRKHIESNKIAIPLKDIMDYFDVEN